MPAGMDQGAYMASGFGFAGVEEDFWWWDRDYWCVMGGLLLVRSRVISVL